MGVKGCDWRGFVDGTDVRDVRYRIWRDGLPSQNVGDSQEGADRVVYLWTLHQRPALQQSAVAPADNGEIRRFGVPRVYQMFGARREIIKDVLLLSQISRMMPFLAVFPAASQIRHHGNAATIQP